VDFEVSSLGATERAGRIGQGGGEFVGRDGLWLGRSWWVLERSGERKVIGSVFSDLSLSASRASVLRLLGEVRVESARGEDGYFRTSFLKRGAAQIISTKFLDDEPVTKGLLDAMNASNGNQLGDLEKAVGVVIECCETGDRGEGCSAEVNSWPGCAGGHEEERGYVGVVEEIGRC